MDKQSLEFLLRDGLSVEEVAERLGEKPSTILQWTRLHGLQTNKQKHAAKGGIEQEALKRLVEAGMTIAEIATAVGLSKTALRYWLGRYGLRTRGAGRRPREAAAAAREAGLLEVTMVCPQHGETQFFLEGRGYYRCKRCRSESVTRRRRKMKEILVAAAGGRWCICGYDRHPSALAFHHVDPVRKRMPVSGGGISYSLNTLRVEANKCVLLCANCYSEVENGVATLPLE